MAAGSNGKINIIRKVEVVEGHGHHGGAWKVAYADFMTAMMAFFLLLWILSSSDEQKLRGIAEYFTDATMPGGSGVLDGATLGPPGTLNASNGAVVARGSELGKVDSPMPAQWEVRDVTQTADPAQTVVGSEVGQHNYPAAGAAASVYDDETATDAEAEKAAAGQADENRETQDAAHADDLARFKALQAEIVQAMQDNPDLRPLQANVIFEKTPEGLRIQVVDQQGKPMFASGKATMLRATQTLIDKMGEAISKLPNKVAISGHTDAVPFSPGASYDNWDLSSDRANATRRILEQSGVDMGRMVQVTGKADTELLVADDPTHPSNRRISVLLQFETPVPAKTTTAKVTDPETPVEPAAPAKESAAVTPEPSQADAPATEVTLLDQTVFENLRSALR